MILSASRRTDIPAFYSKWLINRLREGYLLSRNPMNFRQVTRITINPELIDCFVFWTKNPENMIDSLQILDKSGYNYYFLFTLNSYGKDIESSIPETYKMIEIFKRLSGKIGKERVVWRYDPVLFTETIEQNYHVRKFKHIAKELENYTEKCIISFITMYKKVIANAGKLGIRSLDKNEKEKIAASFSEIASEHKIKLMTCADENDFSHFGIEHGKCIDDELISRNINENVTIPRDKAQRQECRCAVSFDVGMYNTCTHGCVYCYANVNQEVARASFEAHDENSPMLSGYLKEGDMVNEKEAVSHRTNQLSLFDKIQKEKGELI